MKFRASLSALFRFAAAVFLLCAAFAQSAPARAQTEAATIDRLQVDIWPEYDQPSVLVIYHVTLDASTSLPASLTLRIPAAAGKPYALAMQDVSGLYNLQYTLRAAGDWIDVAFTTPAPELRLEYYDPSLKKEGSQREFSFGWPAQQTVRDLSVKVQQPAGATNMTFRPSIGSGRPDSDGLTYYTLAVGNVPAGTPFELQMRYEKSNDTLTNPQQFQPVEPVAPVDTAAGRVSLMEGFPINPLQIILLGLGLLMMIGGVAWYLQSGRTTQPVPARRRHRSPQMDDTSATDGSFCHECGKKSAPGDRFCRACGTQLR